MLKVPYRCYHPRVPTQSSTPALLDAAHADFIQGGVSILAASCTKSLTPVLARAVGCRVSGDRRRIKLLFPEGPARDLVAAVRAGAGLAAVFSQPSTHRTIQLKGRQAEVAAVGPGDAGVAARYADAFVADVCPLGYSEDRIRALVGAGRAELVALAFRPDAAFLQTPGPRAGEVLQPARR
jgi:hypothetical protein